MFARENVDQDHATVCLHAIDAEQQLTVGEVDEAFGFFLVKSKLMLHFHRY